jgi:Asp-tRNA(Asn)/Glu-tRNA(Gln) amidotransferase A subunit family amidase
MDSQSPYGGGLQVLNIDDLCDRVDEIDAELSAFVPEDGRRERLRREAASVAASAEGSPLYGVPVGVKDIIHVDGLPTRAGSRVPPEVLAGPEAAVVTRLRELGALILGKTVTAEFATAAPGPARNPHDPGHTPGGSSSGSAVAVATGTVPLALGTQTIGSVIRPAAYCGTVGFKPSFHRIPTAGVIPNSPTFDTVGLFTRDVAAMSRFAPLVCSGWRSYDAGKRPVLGVPRGPYADQADAAAVVAFDAALHRLTEAGYDVRDVPALDDIDEVNHRHRIVNRFELARTHADWFPRYGDRYHEITAAAIREGQDIDPASYQQALAERELFAGRLAGVMYAAGIDAWIAPSATGPAPAGLESTGDPAMNLPWTHARMPVVALPVNSDGLPLGVQIAARPGADEPLLSWAVAIETVLQFTGYYFDMQNDRLDD